MGAVAGFLIIGFALYLAAMNAFLRTRLFRNAITSSSGSLLVEYRDAYSLWPGRIHVAGLAIRGRDSSVEWILSIGRCDFTVSFLALAHRRFHASHVRGDGLSLRLRLRKDATVGPDVMGALPPVPGFLDPPLKDLGPPPPPLTDANYNLWSIELDDVDANHVHELWIDTVRYTGDLEVRGRWLFRPLRWLEVGPATVDLRSLDVSYGRIEPWCSGATGQLAVTIHPFAIQDVVGAEILGRVSIDGDVRGTVQAAHVLGHWLKADIGSAPAPRAADARLEAQVHLDHGTLGSGTEAHLDRFAMSVHSGSVRLGTAVALQARVDDEGIAHGEIDGEDLDVHLDGTRLRARRFSVAATSPRVQLGLQPAHPEFTTALEALSVERRDIEATADLSAHASISGHRLPTEPVELSGRLVARSLRARLGDEVVAGQLRFDVRARGAHGATTLSGSTVAFDGTVGQSGGPWWARAELVQATVDARHGLRFSARATATAKNGAPLAAVVTKGTAIPEWLVNMVSTEGLVASGDILVAPSTFQARSVSGHAAGVDLGFELAELGREREWALLLDVGAVSIGIDVANDDTDVLLFGAKTWFAKKTASLRALEQLYE